MARDLDSIRRGLLARVPRLVAPAPELTWAAVALVIAPGAERRLDALLVRRAEHEADPWSGHMALPGGRSEPGDAGLEATARRETLEETGLDLEAALFLGQLDDLQPLSRRLPPIFVRPFVFGFGARPEVRPSDEVALHLWTPLESLRAERVATQVLVNGEPREVPSLRLGPHVVWGMTLRILDGLFERLG